LQPFNQSPEAKPRHAAGNRTTFFLPSTETVSPGRGSRVSSTYLVARSTSAWPEFRPSLCLMFSRWVSIVFTLRFRAYAIFLVPSPEPSRWKTCISRSDKFSTRVALPGRRNSGCVSSASLNTRIASFSTDVDLPAQNIGNGGQHLVPGCPFHQVATCARTQRSHGKNAFFKRG